jgi:2'-5' RNA ligase
MRLFVALDIPPTIRTSIEQYVDEMRRVAPDAKWVHAESYHVTLKFIGEWKHDVNEVISALATVQALPVDIRFRSSGFFPNPGAPRVFWAGIEGDGNLVPLAHQVDEVCASLRIRREDHEYHPHLTLARSGSGAPRSKRHGPTAPGMKRLVETIAGTPAPDFGTMHSTEFFLYESRLSPGGAKYTKLKSFVLSGH